ncbi:hydroxymethylglutaryl-CoA reductase, degradative [Lacticaseibacillus sp. GG6-2]
MKFYQQDAAGRLKQLVAEGYLTPEDATFWQQDSVLPAGVASALSENQIGQFALPLGVARNLLVDGVTYQVPMSTEEPSVIAAASNGARLAAMGGGVQTATTAHLVQGEIVFAEVADVPAAAALITAKIPALQAAATAAHPSIVRRGGGLRNVTVTSVAEFLKVTLAIDTQAAMGANIVNTICEALAKVIGEWLHQPALVAILSNASTQLTTAKVAIPVAAVATKGRTGAEVADRIAQLSRLAQVDVARAVTHNKGIMNGIQAGVLASGNDTRAVAAAVHAYAASAGQYRGLSTWQIEDERLRGQLTLPLPVGVVGGAISALPAAQAAKRLGHYTDVATLQRVLAALGLVQNLAALRALAGPGIQQGHMALQANALAMQAGAQGDEIQAVAAALQNANKDLATAQALLAQIRKQKG